MLVTAGEHARTRGRRFSAMFSPWLWVGLAVLFVAIFLLYPLFYTIALSFYDATGTNFVGLKNYQLIFTNLSLLEVLRNNLIWLVLATVGTVLLGLIIAVLVDRVRFESVAKAAVFVPMALS